MSKAYVVEGATLECTLGVTSSKLVVTPHGVMLTDKNGANIGDAKPFINILPFGACNITSPPKPCTPACAMWIGGKEDVHFEGLPALLNTDKLVCTAGGGMIRITDSGQ
jgi:hypothetical protein